MSNGKDNLVVQLFPFVLILLVIVSTLVIFVCTIYFCKIAFKESQNRGLGNNRGSVDQTQTLSLLNQIFGGYQTPSVFNQNPEEVIDQNLVVIHKNPGALHHIERNSGGRNIDQNTGDDRDGEASSEYPHHQGQQYLPVLRDCDSPPSYEVVTQK